MDSDGVGYELYNSMAVERPTGWIWVNTVLRGFPTWMVGSARNSLPYFLWGWLGPGDGTPLRVVVAVATAFVGLRPVSAFAVDRQADGDITVTVMKLADGDGLERALQDKGIAAEVTYYAEETKPSDLDNGSSNTGCPPVGVTVDPSDNGGFTFTLNANYVAAHGSVLHLDAAGGRTSDDWTAVSLRWVDSNC